MPARATAAASSTTEASPETALPLLALAGFGSMAAMRVGEAMLHMAWIGDRMRWERRQVVLARRLADAVVGMMTGAWAGGALAQRPGWRWASGVLAFVPSRLHECCGVPLLRGDAVLAAFGLGGMTHAWSAAFLLCATQVSAAARGTAVSLFACALFVGPSGGVTLMAATLSHGWAEAGLAAAAAGLLVLGPTTAHGVRHGTLVGAPAR